MGGIGQRLQRQFMDGHRVLAFGDAGSAEKAAQMVTDHASRLRQHYAALLTPLLQSTAADGRLLKSDPPLKYARLSAHA